MKKYLILLIALCASSFAVAESAVTTDAEVEIGYGYDSNVSVDDVDLNTNVGDQFADIRLSGDVKFENASGTEFSAGLTLTEKRYNTFDRFDGSLALLSLSANKPIGDLEVSLTARYIDYQLDGDGFLDLTQLAKTFSWFPGKKTYIRVGYEYSDENYDRNPDRDNDRHEVNASLFYFINGLRHYVSVQAEAAAEQAEEEIFDNDLRQVRVSYHRKFDLFEKDATLKLRYRYQNRRYDEDLNPAIDAFREDDRHRYEVELDIELNRNWSILTEAIYNDYRSSLNSADYTQEVFQVTVAYKF